MMKAARPPKAARPAMTVWRAPPAREEEVEVAPPAAEVAEARRDERLPERLANDPVACRLLVEITYESNARLTEERAELRDPLADPAASVALAEPVL